MIKSFVISLDDESGKKRLSNFKKNVQSHLNFPVKKFLSRRHVRGGTFGCWESHKNVLKKAHDEGYEKVLIFEDDAVITNSFSLKLLQDYISELDYLSSWDLVGLGGISSCWSSAPQKVGNYFFQTPFFELHAYVASRKFMKNVIEMEYEGQVDYAFARRAYATSYLTTTEIFTQDSRMGSHNKLQSIILPLRDTFKYINRLAMTSHVRIRTIVSLFILTMILCRKTTVASVGILLLLCFDMVLDPSFMFRSSQVFSCPILTYQ
jgi:hypothetical protein